MRVEKVAILTEVIERVKASDYCFILNYGGLKVDELSVLRNLLAGNDAKAMVVKNTYLVKIAREQGWEGVADLFSGPSAIITGSGDVAEVAKILVEFAKKSGKGGVKGAAVESAILTAEDVEALSKLPSKDVMRSVLLSTMLAPATNLVRVLNAPLLNLLYALKAYEDKQNESAA